MYIFNIIYTLVFIAIFYCYFRFVYWSYCKLGCSPQNDSHNKKLADYVVDFYRPFCYHVSGMETLNELFILSLYFYVVLLCFQCFDAVNWQQEGHLACKKLSGGVLAWSYVWGEVQICIWPSWRGHMSGARCRFAYGPAATTTHCLLLQ